MEEKIDLYPLVGQSVKKEALSILVSCAVCSAGLKVITRYDNGSYHPEWCIVRHLPYKETRSLSTLILLTQSIVWRTKNC